jgi:hypothetical protein
MKNSGGKIKKNALAARKENYFPWEKDWYSLIRYSLIWYCICYPSSSYQKESCINSIIIDPDSFGKGTTKKRNIDWLNGV